MEKVLCNIHGSLCMLKTGVKDGPNKGKSFYVCVEKQGCDFSHVASVAPSHCLQHEEAMVELQALTFSLQQQSHRLFYRCVLGKKAGQRWCGSLPWTAPQKEKRNPLADAQLQPSCLPPVRNPFKVPEQRDKDSEWRRTQRAGAEEKSSAARHEAEGGQKENVKGGGAAREQEESDEKEAESDEKEAESDEEEAESDEEEAESDEEEAESVESYRGKQLPAGMKVKKRVSQEERKTPKSEEEQGAARNESRQDPQRDATQQPISSQDDRLSTSVPSRESPQTEASGTKTQRADDDDDDDDVVLVSVKAANQKAPAAAAVQKSLTAFAGFQPASKVKGQQGDPRGMRSLLTAQLQQKKATLSAVNVAALPDKGERLRTQVKELEDALESLSLAAASEPEPAGSQGGSDSSQGNASSRPGGAILLPAPPAPGPSHQGYSQYGASSQGGALYGGRMTADRLLAVKNATCETIDHLHRSLASCPDPEAEAPDPKGIKVTLLPHQRRALAWLLWRENQSPCGGILADDMGLGKTLTMIAVILATKTKQEVEKDQKWVSRADSALLVSKGTLIICPASLVHHWKREIERHVKTGKLSVCLYHGPNRERSASVLAGYDVVVTTYSLVSKELPVQTDRDAEAEPPRSAPLARVTWARLVLDEAHNIKNPKVQTSMAVCQLRAGARWAVTGTPIQNNLLDMYSLLKFLRCSPFDEYKVWKAQVDNGSNRGRERLSVLTRTLLLRRAKDQLDSSGKPLVSLPDRTCEVHRVKLSKAEQDVYDVVFAQSRSTLQNYLRRHEGTDGRSGKASGANPFEKVAQEFGLSQTDSASQQPQQASSTVHILSLLLRLRQCCCHLSLLQKTLDTSELQGDGIVLSLEEQLSALSLSPSPSTPRPADTVSLNGTDFPSRLFEDSRESTKISAIVSELKAIRLKGSDQKSVIVSQWTSMLRIVAVHLRQMGLKHSVIDGSVPPKRRMDLVEEFNTRADGAQVMLVSLCAGGVGLNLIGGNHLFLIDMHWNPALEDQACDRIYRVGQRKDVTIHRFVCDGTVEEKISTLQAKKKELAQNVLSGTGSTVTKLSLADLRLIFGV